MRGEKVVFVVFVSLLILLMFVSIVDGFFHKDEPGLAPFNATVTVGNQAPQIILTFNVTDFVSFSGLVTPVENTSIEVNFSFILDDPNGAGDIDLTSAVANYTYNGINRTSQVCFAESSCPTCPDPTRQRNFTCSVLMQYYNEAALRQWVVNVTASDLSGSTALNDTTNFTLAETTAFAIISSPNSVTWTSISVDTNSINQSADNNITMENTGNFAFTIGEVNASEINGSTTPATQHIYPENFSVTSSYGVISLPECDISGTHGNKLLFGEDVSILGFSLPISTDTSLGQENSTFCIPLNLSRASLDPAQTYSSITRDWEITLS